MTSHTHQQELIRKASEEATRIQSQMTAEQRRDLSEAGERRSAAINATPARSYRSLLAVEHEGKDKAEIRDAV